MVVDAVKKNRFININKNYVSLFGFTVTWFQQLGPYFVSDMALWFYGLPVNG